MLLKLYKKEEGTTLYWEAWDEGDEIIVHFGQLGQIGETTNIPLAEFEPPETAILRHADEAREAGFAEIDHEDLFELIVQYQIEGNGGADDVEFGAKIEATLNDCLGWTGLGHCDGCDVGEGNLNVYCYVVDPTICTEPIVAELRETDMLRDAIIAYQDKDENFIVLWPADFEGAFSY